MIYITRQTGNQDVIVQPVATERVADMLIARLSNAAPQGVRYWRCGIDWIMGRSPKFGKDNVRVTIPKQFESLVRTDWKYTLLQQREARKLARVGR